MSQQYSQNSSDFELNSFMNEYERKKQEDDREQERRRVETEEIEDERRMQQVAREYELMQELELQQQQQQQHEQEREEEERRHREQYERDTQEQRTSREQEEEQERHRELSASAQSSQYSSICSFSNYSSQVASSYACLTHHSDYSGGGGLFTQTSEASFITSPSEYTSDHDSSTYFIRSSQESSVDD